MSNLACRLEYEQANKKPTSEPIRETTTSSHKASRSCCGDNRNWIMLSNFRLPKQAPAQEYEFNFGGRLLVDGGNLKF